MTAAGSRPVSFLVGVTAIACIPPVTGALFALEPLFGSDRAWLWTLATGFALLAFFVRRTTRPWLVRLALAGVALTACELSARLALQFTDWPRQRLAAYGRVTYPERLAFRGHPFSQFTGRPSVTLHGNEALRGDSPFNERGFHGPYPTSAKPTGTCRIVCLGASTTASGYPAAMQHWLTTHAEGETRFECVNLAHGFYNSTHSVVNFALHGIDLEPDYVVIHHGWNDVRAAQNAARYRSDHTHVLTPFEPPSFADWPLIRASVLYRFARFRLFGTEADYLGSRLTVPFDAELGYDETPAIATFVRNLRTIHDLATARGITPVYVTLPHSTDPDAKFGSSAEAIARFATAMREFATERRTTSVFVDLDAAWTGQNERFKDVGHVVPGAIAEKAQTIGEAILAHRRR